MSEKIEKPVFDPHVVVLYCGHCVLENCGLVPALEGVAGFSANAAMMPCSSRIEISHLLKILEHGADGVEVVACPAEKCKSLVGSMRAEKRIQYARSMLDSIHLGAERIGISRKTGLSAEALVEIATGRAEAVRPLGPNPMKKGDSK